MRGEILARCRGVFIILQGEVSARVGSHVLSASKSRESMNSMNSMDFDHGFGKTGMLSVPRVHYSLFLFDSA